MWKVTRRSKQIFRFEQKKCLQRNMMSCFIVRNLSCNVLWMFAVDSRPRFSKCILQKSTFMAIHTFGFYPDSVVVDSEMSENILPCKAFLHFFFGFTGTHKCFKEALRVMLVSSKKEKCKVGTPASKTHGGFR